MKKLNIGQRHTIAKYWKELVAAGWLTREQKQDDKGRMMGGFDYILEWDNRSVDNPHMGMCGENRNGENPNIGKIHTLNNNDLSNNNDLFTNNEKVISTEMPPKNGKKKWEQGSFPKAKSIFDECYRQFHRNKSLPIGVNEGIYWNPKEIGQLGNLMKMLRHKAAHGEKPAIYKSDMEFVNRALNMFLGASAKLIHAWYMDKFTPSNFVTNFEALYMDVKKNIKSGYTGYKNKNGATTQMANNAASRQALIELAEEASSNF